MSGHVASHCGERRRPLFLVGSSPSSPSPSRVWSRRLGTFVRPRNPLPPAKHHEFRGRLGPREESAQGCGGAVIWIGAGIGDVGLVDRNDQRARLRSYDIYLIYIYLGFFFGFLEERHGSLCLWASALWIFYCLFSPSVLRVGLVLYSLGEALAVGEGMVYRCCAFRLVVPAGWRAGGLVRFGLVHYFSRWGGWLPMRHGLGG